MQLSAWAPPGQKTHTAESDGAKQEECNVKKRKDSVLIKLGKKKKDHHWYELFKTKGIGE